MCVWVTVVGRIYSRRRRRDSGSILLVEFTVAHLQLRPKLMLLAHATVHLPPPVSHTHTHIGTDFHGAMVATAPEKKLLIGRRPVRNWTQLQCFSLFPLNLLHLLLGKSTNTAATRAALFCSNMHQIVCRLGLRPRPHWGNLQRSPRPTTCI